MDRSPPPSSVHVGGDGEEGEEEVVREGELLVDVLQVRSFLGEAGAPKKVRAILSGTRARRLVAHRRLIAAISVEVEQSFFSDPVGEAVGGLIVSAVRESGDDVDPGPGGNSVAVGR